MEAKGDYVMVCRWKQPNTLGVALKDNLLASQTYCGVVSPSLPSSEMNLLLMISTMWNWRNSMAILFNIWDTYKNV